MQKADTSPIIDSNTRHISHLSFRHQNIFTNAVNTNKSRHVTPNKVPDTTRSRALQISTELEPKTISKDLSKRNIGENRRMQLTSRASGQQQSNIFVSKSPINRKVTPKIENIFNRTLQSEESVIIEEPPCSPPRQDYTLFPVTVNRRDDANGGSPLKFDANIMVKAANASLSDMIKH